MTERHRHLLRRFLHAATAVALTSSSLALAQPIPKREKIDLGKSHAVAKEIEITNALEAGAQDLKNNKEDLALEHFYRAIELDPNRARTYYVIGSLYGRNTMSVQAGGGISVRMDAARQWWQTYLELATDHTDPDWADVHAELGDFAWSQYRYSRFRDYEKTWLIESEGHYLRAYEAYLETERTARLYHIELMLATISQIDHRYKDAIRYLHAAESRIQDSGNVFSRVDLRRVIMLNHIWDGRPEEALEIAKSVLDLYSIEQLVGREEYITITMGILSTAFLKVEDFEQALLYANMALNAARQMDLDLGASGYNRETASVQSHIANIYFEMNDLERAEQFYREALANNPTEPTYMNNLAWAIVVRSENLDPRLKEAVELSERAVREYPTAANLDTLAEVYTRLERYDDALDLIEKALLMHPGDPYLERQHTRIEEARDGFATQPGISFFRRKLWRPPTDANL